MSQGSNANDVYFAKLTEYSRCVDPYFTSVEYASDSRKAKQIRGKQWDDITFETSADMLEEDLNFFKNK